MIKNKQKIFIYLVLYFEVGANRKILLLTQFGSI